MLGIGASGLVGPDFVTTLRNTCVVMGIAVVGATPLPSRCLGWLREKGFDWVEGIWLFTVFCLSLLECVSSTYNPFIYFNF